jgi:hypothetical protein
MMDALAVRYNQLDGAVAACRAMTGETEAEDDEEAELTGAVAYNE